MKPLLLAVMLHANGHYRDYDIQQQAYGLEMQIDNEWNAELVLIAPKGELNAITTNTDVTGDDVAIVSAGVSGIPANEDFSELKDKKNNWLLLGDPRAYKVLDGKPLAAIKAGCRVIVYVNPENKEQTKRLIDELQEVRLDNLVIAIACQDLENSERTFETLSDIRDAFIATVGKSLPRFILCGKFDTELLRKHLTNTYLDGFLLLDDHYDSITDILDFLRLMSESPPFLT